MQVTPVYITSIGQLMAELRSIAECTEIGIDTETTGLNPFCDKIRLIQLGAWTGTELKGLVIDTWKINKEQVLKALSVFFGRPRNKIFFNAKFDLKFLRSYGLEFESHIADTMLMYYVWRNGGMPIKTNLATVLNDPALLDLNIPPENKKKMQKSEWDSDILTDEQILYAARDAGLLVPLYDALKEVLLTDTNTKDGDRRYSLWHVYENIEAYSLPAVAAMEYNGIPVDRDIFHTLADALVPEIQALEQDIKALFAEGGVTVNNLNSWQQLLPAFAALGYPIANTQETTLNDCEHVVAYKLLQYKEKTKLMQFVDKLPLFVNPITGRIHCSFNMAGTVSGRFSSSEPNMQQIPRPAKGEETPLRNFIKAPQGREIVVADYSQVELVIAAQIAQERKMIEAYNSGQDIHKLTASMLVGKPVSEISKQERQLAKAVNFGLCLVPGTPVVTNRGWIAIENVACGDLVLTHKGNWKPVTETQQLRATKTYKITTCTGRVVESTGDHMWRLLSPSANGRPSRESWIEASELREGDYLVFNKYEHMHKLDNTYELKDLRILGWFLSEGSNSVDSGMRICQDKIANEDVHSHMFQVLSEYGCIHWEEGTVTRFKFPAELRDQFTSIFSEDINFSAKSAGHTFKTLLPKLSRTEKLELLAGLWDGDGCCSANTQSSNKITLQYTSISMELLESIQLLLESLGIDSKIYAYANNRAYQLHITGTDGKLKFIKEVPSVKCSRITYNPKKQYSAEEKVVSVEEMLYTGWVYDITVEDDHSFVANGLVTHNCYGMGAAKLELYARNSYGVFITLEEATRYRNIFFETYPDLAEWHRRSSYEIKCPSTTATFTLSGRRRLFSRQYNAHNSIRFTAYVNTQDQGTGGDITKVALGLIHNEFKKPYMLEAAPMVILTVHDEIVVECTEGWGDKLIKPVICEKMIQAGRYFIPDVPVSVEAATAESWGKAK